MDSRAVQASPLSGSFVNFSFVDLLKKLPDHSEKKPSRFVIVLRLCIHPVKRDSHKKIHEKTVKFIGMMSPSHILVWMTYHINQFKTKKNDGKFFTASQVRLHASFIAVRHS